MERIVNAVRSIDWKTVKDKIVYHGSSFVNSVEVGIISFFRWLNYPALIVALLLLFSANAGYLESYPNLEWIAGVILRAWDFCLGILRLIFEAIMWFLSLLEPWPIFGDLYRWLEGLLFG